MGKILLATDRRWPGRPAFKYAVQLCRENKADLSVLQIRAGKNGRNKVNGHLKKLIGLSQEQGIGYRINIRTGKAGNEIARFVRNRPEIILAVYDRSIFSLMFGQKNEKELVSQSGIPFVVVQNGRLLKFIKSIRNFFTEEKFMLAKISSMFKTNKKNSKETSEQVTDQMAAEVSVTAAENPPEEAGRLVVVGNESAFPDSIMDYALEMAGRMDYQIIALNTAPLSCDTFRIFKNAGNQLCDEFQEMSCKNAAAFEQKAKEKNIPFIHVVKFEETDDALEAVQKEFGEISFIVSEPESKNASYNRNENENRMSAGLCVYSMR